MILDRKPTTEKSFSD